MSHEVFSHDQLKMTDKNFVKVKYVNNRDFTFPVAFNKTLRASGAGQVFQPVGEKQAGARGPVHADPTV